MAYTTYYSPTSSGTIYNTTGYININATFNTIISASNIDMYDIFIFLTESKLEKYILENITKEDIAVCGVEYAYDKIEDMIDTIILCVIKQKEENGFRVQDGNYYEIVKAIRKLIDYNALRKIIDKIMFS